MFLKDHKWVRFVISHLFHANRKKSRIVTWSRAGVLISCTESNFHDGSVEGQNTSSGSMPSMDSGRKLACTQNLRYCGRQLSDCGEGQSRPASRLWLIKLLPSLSLRRQALPIGRRHPRQWKEFFLQSEPGALLPARIPEECAVYSVSGLPHLCESHPG